MKFGRHEHNPLDIFGIESLDPALGFLIVAADQEREP
jgi:hypothetical protein